MPPKGIQVARKSTGGIRLRRQTTRGKEPGRQPATKAADPKPAKMARKSSGSRVLHVSTGAQDPGVQPSTRAAHPAYWEMVKDAISSLKQRRGSSQQALAKYLVDKYGKGLPDNFRKTLSKRLKEWSKADGRLTKVKNSFKLT